MNNKSSRVFSLLLVASLFFTGCASYQIKPTAASITIPQAGAPISAVVGISQVDQKLQGGFPDMTRSIKQGLDESKLFKEVYYPMRSTDKVDGQINLRLSSSFKMDGALFPKSFFTGFFFFLPAPLITYDHQYLAECRLELFKGDKLIKTYTANARVDMTHKLFAPAAEIEVQATDATVKLLSHNLVSQLIADRNALSQALEPPAPAAVTP